MTGPNGDMGDPCLTWPGEVDPLRPQPTKETNAMNTLSLLHSAAAPLAKAAGDAVTATEPSYWIFGAMPQGVALMLFKAVIILVTVGGLCLLLRCLYGPGGCLRPKEFGTEHIAERKARNAMLKELKRRHKAGELTRGEYLEQRWEILRKP